MFIKKTFLVIFVLTVSSDQVQSGPEFDWFESVRTRLSDLHQVHTALIMHHHNPESSDILKDKLFRTIMRSIPSVIFEINDQVTELKGLNFGSASELSVPRLLIFYGEYSGDNEQIYRVMQLMNKLTYLSINCYFLISVRTSSKFNRAAEDILRHAWNDSMLNIMIAEIRLVINDRFLVILHHFNPFRQQFYHTEFSPGMEIFPDLAKNWHGHRMNVHLTKWPPFTLIAEDKKNEVNNLTGPNVVLTQTLAKYLNFSPSFKKIDVKNFSQPDIGIEKFVEIYNKLEIDMVAHPITYHTKDVLEESMRSRTIMTQNLRMLMPQQYYSDHKPLNNALESSGLALGIVMIIWLAVILLKFDKNIWHLFDIMGLIISIPVPQQPSRTCERSLFIVVVMLGMIYSNKIYASLANLGVNPLVEVKYNTLEDIDASGLTQVALGLRSTRAFGDAAGAELKLAEKSIIVRNNRECSRMAIEHRNVSCVVYELEGTYYKERTRTKEGKYQVKFAKPILWSGPAAFGLRRGFPGKQHINKLIGRCLEAGLLDRWYLSVRQFYGHHTVPGDNEPEKNVLSELLQQLIVVLTVGHSLATLVFIAELLTHRFMRDLHRGELIVALQRLWKYSSTKSQLFSAFSKQLSE